MQAYLDAFTLIVVYRRMTHSACAGRDVFCDGRANA